MNAITIAKRSPWGHVSLQPMSDQDGAPLGLKLGEGDLLPPDAQLTLTAGELIALWTTKPPMRPDITEQVRAFAADAMSKSHDAGKPAPVKRSRKVTPPVAAE